MNNNLPIKKENSFFEKIKNFFRKIFRKQTKEENLVFHVQKNIEIKDNESKEEFKSSLKFETKNDFINDMKREELLDNLEKDPNLFYKLSIEKLEKIENYYKQSIGKYEEKLATIRNAI